MKVRWHGHTEEPQVRNIKPSMIAFDQGLVTFKDRNGSAILIVPVARLIEAEEENVNG